MSASPRPGAAGFLIFMLLTGGSLEGQLPRLGPFLPESEGRSDPPKDPAALRPEARRVRGTGQRGSIRLVLVEERTGLTRVLQEPGSRLPEPGGEEPDERISMQLSEASLPDFFRLLSRLTRLNLIIDPDVQGTITLSATRVPASELLQGALESHRLETVTTGELIRIKRQPARDQGTPAVRVTAPPSPAAQVTLVRHLDYSDVETLATQIREHGSLLSAQGNLLVDTRTNTLMLTDAREVLQRVENLIETLDRPQPQVQIEARIVEVTAAFAREIGLEFGFQLGTSEARNRAEIGARNPGSLSHAFLTFSSGRLMDTVRLDAMLRAGVVEGRARMLSKPRVTAQNNAEAIMTQGSKIPIPVQSNFSTRVRFETAALRLTVTPRISRRRTVLLKLKVENNVPDFTRTVFGIPTILTSEADTVVLIPDRGTAVIGGILVETDRESETRVPGLGGVPVLGAAFRRTAKQRETREILFFLTSTIQNPDPSGRLPDPSPAGKAEEQEEKTG